MVYIRHLYLVQMSDIEDSNIDQIFPVGEEATICLSPQPPNQPTPDRYISVRITTPHTNLYKITATVVHDVDRYIIYPHKAGTSNEHFHICIALGDTDDAVKLCERYRKRSRAINGGGAGKIMCKTHSNGCASFVGYVKHEIAEACLKGFSQEWFDEIEVKHTNVGAYMEKEIKKRPKNEDHFYQITFMNMERVTHRYRAQNGIKSTDLEDTLEHMHANGWRLQVTILKQGIPAQFYDEFKAKCEGKTTFTSNRFKRMRTVERWRESEW